MKKPRGQMIRHDFRLNAFTLGQMRDDAARRGISLSALARWAWIVARPKIEKMPPGNWRPCLMCERRPAADHNVFCEACIGGEK